MCFLTVFRENRLPVMDALYERQVLLHKFRKILKRETNRDEELKNKKREELAQMAETIFAQSDELKVITKQFIGKFRMLYKIVFSYKGKVSLLVPLGTPNYQNRTSFSRPRRKTSKSLL